jgi:5-deoxy-glucuronate isomerase
MSRLHIPADPATPHDLPVHITPERAGWSYTGLDVVRLNAGERRIIETNGRELVVLPLSGACVVEVDDLRFDLHGRPDVFSAVDDFAYAGAGS